MGRFAIRRILAEEEALAHTPARKILKRLPGIPVETSKAGPPGGGQEGPGDDMGKDSLNLVCHKGEFLKPCPGTKGYICCGYRILNVGTNCPLDCSYCILQSYFNRPYLNVFVNTEQALPGILDAIDREPETIFRIGTGEFMDSLALDPVVGWSDLLLSGFSERKNAVLEFKTKTAAVNRLLSLKQRDRIIVSWSLNSPYITSREEHGSASLTRRLQAARRCQLEGFALAFHFDPLIQHPGWQSEYLRTIDLMDRYLDPKRIVWISLGSFRFMPALKWTIRRRHPKTSVLNGEFILGLDGKMRYFKPTRIELYRYLSEKLQQWHPDAGPYLCMEADDVWEKSLGWSPKDTAGLTKYLDHRVRKIFG